MWKNYIAQVNKNGTYILLCWLAIWLNSPYYITPMAADIKSCDLKKNIELPKLDSFTSVLIGTQCAIVACLGIILWKIKVMSKF